MNTSMCKYVGVDGCKAGWFSVGLDDNNGYELVVFSEFSQVTEYYINSDLILVDMPIGMVKLTDDTHGGRLCERAARKIAGSSVFPTRSRTVVYEVANVPTSQYERAYDKAMRLNRSGKFRKNKVPGITKQSHEITPKIVELDKEVIKTVRKKGPKIREIHPEICFWALNGKELLKSSKRNSKGRGKRAAVLERYLEGHPKRIYDSACKRTSKFYDYAGQKYRKFLMTTEVARDDILDALAGAVTAKIGSQDESRLKKLPNSPCIDCKKLPMEMVYVEAVAAGAT